MSARATLVLIAPLAAQAQLSLVTFDGSTETPVAANSVYQYGAVDAGTNGDVRFRARDTGNSAIALTRLGLSGAGFTILGAPTLPYTIAPGNFLEFTVRFLASFPASYSANLEVNAIRVILLATAAPAPSLTVFPECTIAGGSIDFGRVANASVRLCNFALQNPNAQPLTVSALNVSGAFQGTHIPAVPFTLQPAQAVTFSIQVTPPCGSGSLTGTLTVNTHAYPLAAASFIPAPATAALNFDTTAMASAEQHTLSLTLPSPSQCGADGNINLAFSSAIPAARDDPAIVFVDSNARTAPFHIPPGGSQASFVFNTGTTAGTITFTAAGTQASISIPPALISVDTASASNQRLGDLDIEIIGYDNTYTAGVMSFAFFDKSGKAIGAGPISPDFTSNFKSYFGGQPAGSSFRMRVSFPVVGDQTQVSGVEVSLTNAAGRAQTQRLTFQ